PGGSRMESYFLGFDPKTLAERFDYAAAQERYGEIAEVRGLEELIEKIGLLIALGRPDDAQAAAAEALRQARFASDREPLMRARIANSRLLRAEGRHEQSIHELSDVVVQAGHLGRHDLVADALRQRALVRLAMDDVDQARADLNEALAVLVRAGAGAREIDTTMIAIGTLLDRRE